jgi:uncharacterized protein (DUF2062 family)
METKKSLPLHYLSALIVIALDWLWTPVEGTATVSVVGLVALPILMGGIFLISGLSVSLIQHFVKHETWGTSIAKGIALGIFAAVPYPFVGSIAGGLFLSYAGVKNIPNLLKG